MKKVLVKYEEDFGRHGSLDALFICEESVFKRMIKAGSLYLGEVLGKHSEVSATLSPETLSILSKDEKFISKLEEVFKISPDYGYVSGLDMLAHFLEQEIE